MFAAAAAPAVAYERRRPESLALYHVVANNLATLYGAVDDGALRIALPKFVRKELEGFRRMAATAAHLVMPEPVTRLGLRSRTIVAG